MKAAQLALNAIKEIGSWENPVLTSNDATVSECVKKQRHCFSSNVQSGTKDLHLGRTVCDPFYHMIHPRKEKHSR